MSNTKRWIGWHFMPENGRTAHGHNKLVKVGQTLRITGELCLDKHGLHASKRAIDALDNAPGSIICRVELIGERLDAKDKSCALQRKVLAMADATETLHRFACWCAEQALKAERKAGREPAKESWEAIKIKIKWLDGKATDDQLAAARSAAWSAARSAAWSAAESAARSAQNKKLESMLVFLVKSVDKISKPT